MDRKRNIDQKIGKRLEEIRKHRRMSRTTLARLIGVSQSAIDAYEQCRCRIPSDRLDKFERVLRCPHNSLREEPGSRIPRVLVFRRRIEACCSPRRAAAVPAVLKRETLMRYLIRLRAVHQGEYYDMFQTSHLA